MGITNIRDIFIFLTYGVQIQSFRNRMRNRGVGNAYFYVSVCVLGWGERSSLILGSVHFLEKCQDSWWGRTCRNIFVGMLDEPLRRKLILKKREGRLDVLDQVKSVQLVAIRGEKETLG